MVDQKAEILVVGAGPTGLSMANTCLRFGLPVRLIDRAETPAGVSKALAVWQASLEGLAAMGVADDVLAHGQPIRQLHVGDGNRTLASIPVAEGVDSPFPSPLFLPQSRTEALLAKRLNALGGAVERGVTLSALQQDGGGVDVTLEHADGRQEQARYAYVVGCDGARSAVRQGLEVAFDGETEPQTFTLCDAPIEGSLDPSSIYVWWNKGGAVALFPVESGTWRVTAMRASGASEPPTIEEMQSNLDRFGPPGLRLGAASWLSTFHINERVARHFRSGRCLLAGDAAHIHSPAGGQGMNTGIQDALNLGWKLASVMRGIGDPAVLLDSYEAERRPVARAVVKGATQKLHFGMGTSPLLRLAKDVMIPMAARIPAVRRQLQLELSETRVHYGDGPLVELGRGSPKGEPSVGDRAREATIVQQAHGEPQSLWRLLAAPRHTLLAFGAAGAPPGAAECGEAVQVLHVAEGAETLRQRYGVSGEGWVLIRPDQVVAARGGSADAGLFAAYAEKVLLRQPR